MPGDYSRKTFDRTNYYSGVLKQQGRVQLDADDNEQLDIQHYRDETEAIDVIGQSGVPKKLDAFKIGIASGGKDLTISAGRIYVEGLLCELDQASSYTAQPYFPNPEFATVSSPPVSPPDGTVNLVNGNYAVVLDAWKREITALDDQRIREVALGGPDTTTRLQNVWQVRLVEVDITSPPSSPPAAITCKSSLPQYDKFIAPSDGTLNARTQPPPPSDNACLLPPGTGYTRLENQHYRVEIQNGGTRSQATFKWSRDNASVQTTISNAAGNVLTVDDTGKDEVLSFAPGQWVEIVSEESTLNSAPNPLVQIANMGPGENDITLSSSVAAFTGVPNLKLRRWDQTVSSATANGLSAASSTWIDLEDGVQVSFSTTGNFRAGDYWLIPARTATGDIEWPNDGTAAKNPIAQTPKGIIHHYCRLALVQSTGGTLSLIEDCRKPFPPLTEICAVDVCFDNEVCSFDGAKNVQEALDNLCRRHESGSQCTFVVGPDDDVQAVFDSIPPKASAEVCFQVGDYVLGTSVTVEGKGDLKISGAGFGTRFVAKDGESVFRFQSCRSVSVRDISAQADEARAERGRDFIEHLNGTLNFLDCLMVNVDSVWLKCGSAPLRAATCITVRNEESRGSARIQRCLLEPGHQQTGVLLVNVRRSHVEDNVINGKKKVRLKQNRSREDKRYVASIRSLLIREVRLGDTRGKHDKSNVTFRSGEAHAIQFRTEKSLKNAWKTLFSDHPGSDINSSRSLLRHVKRLATRIVMDDEFRGDFKAFDAYINAVSKQSVSVGYQGITVGGDGATDVRVLNNTIQNVMQGVHVGLSRRADDLRAMQTVTIAGNTLSIVLTPLAPKRDRHGIFVGNCDSLIIENNNARLTRTELAEKIEIDGIRVWGKLGDRALITRNYLAEDTGDQDGSFDVGINFRPIEGRRDHQMWLANFNVAPSRQHTVVVSHDAQEDNNLPV